MKINALALLIAIAIAAIPARAAAEEEVKPWELDFGAAYTVMGNLHKTGGLTPTIAGRRVFVLDPTFTASAGLGVAFFGIGDEPHWLGFMAGPTGSISARPWDAADVRLTLRAHLDFGQVPTCNDWMPRAACLTNTGFIPAASFSADVYTKGPAGVTFVFLVRDVDTIAWHGAALSGMVGGRLAL